MDLVFVPTMAVRKGKTVSAITVQIAKEVEAQLAEMASREHTSTAGMIERIVIRYLQDADDYRAVEEFRASGERGTPMSEVRRILGLDD